MKWKNYFIPTLKEIPLGTEAISHQLLLRAGMVHMLTSGVYSYLPLGLKVLRKVESIIREEMNAAGAIEVFLPCLHPLDLWKKTGRDKTLNEVMIKFKDTRGKEMCLGPTHEEIITNLVKDFVQSYKQLPIILYQIQTKFRDELRPRFGIVRASEFIMKDAYSFDCDINGLRKSYEKMLMAYKKIFKRLELDVIILEADSGAMGGDISHEFMVPAPIGEDTVIYCDSCGMHSPETNNIKENMNCPKCDKAKLKKHVAIELGHIFQLGTKYSSAQGAKFIDKNGKQYPIIMGCYGIGVSRVIAAIIEKHNDNKGIIWPKSVAPFDVEILPLFSEYEDEIMQISNQYYDALQKAGIDVLIDDRDESPGRKFNDADLIGIPLRITIGKRNLEKGNVEIKKRNTAEVILTPKENAIEKIINILNN